MFYFIKSLYVGLCILCLEMKTFLSEESILHYKTKEIIASHLIWITT